MRSVEADPGAPFFIMLRRRCLNMAEKRIGEVTHYYSKIGVAVVELSDTLRLGDTIHIKGATSDFQQQVESMQLEHQPIETAEAGQAIGLKVVERVRRGDVVYKVE